MTDIPSLPVQAIRAEHFNQDLKDSETLFSSSDDLRKCFKKSNESIELCFTRIQLNSKPLESHQSQKE